MSPLFLVGVDAADLREMALDWWAAPLARAVLLHDRGPTSVVLVLSAEGGKVRGRLRGGSGQSIDQLLAPISRRLLDAPLGALDADPAFSEAFGPFCPESGEVIFARFTIERLATGYRRLVTEVCGKRLRPDAARAVVEALDPDVAAVIDGLATLDRHDALAATSLQLVTAIRAGQRFAARAALKTLQGLLHRR